MSTVEETVTDIQKLILNASYVMRIDPEIDKDIIEQLDYWLENWLYRKEQCPCCGEVD